MLHRFGAELVKLQDPFQPEGGAYSGDGHHHNHDHSEHHHA
jgi:urease accessory protein